MKIYTEVVYTWDDEKNELVKESEKSFDYEGDVTECGWGGSFGSIVRRATNTVTNVKPPSITIPKVTTPDIPIPNIPTPNIVENVGGIIADNPLTGPDVNLGIKPPDGSNLTNTLNTGIGKLGEGINAVGGLVADGGSIITRNLNELAKVGKEALTGQGGYADDAPGEGPGPGPTGFEAANAQTTLLTGQRRKGQGRSAHAGSGSATTV